MNARVRWASVLLLASGTALAQTPSQQVPTFKAEVDYVEVDAVVTDAKGNFVRDLKPEDFQVLEDGKPQSIAAFALVDIPIESEETPAGQKRPVEPDVKSNARPFDGRVYVMLIDDAHTLFGRSDRVKRAARQFIERRLGANDLMAVVHTAGPTDASQEFTSSKRLLLAAVDKTSGRKLQSVTAAKTERYNNLQNLGRSTDKVTDPDDAERGQSAHATLRTLREVSEWFKGVRGRRKSILFVSEGIDYDMTNPFDNPSASTLAEDTREVIASAARSNVAIYGIDPRGLTSLGDEEIEIASYPDDTSLGIGHTSLLNELSLSQDSLRVLSNETGGFAAVNENDFQHVYERIVKENSSYYVLSYHPPSDRRDGKFHKIVVHMSRPDLKVLARKGYASPKGKPQPPKAADPKAGSPEVQAALDSPLPTSGLALSVFAASFKGAVPKMASVLLVEEARGKDLKLDASDKLELSYMAVDTQGNIKAGNNEAIALNLKPDTRSRVEQTGLRITTRFDLAPGRYQLRLAARDGGGGNVGSLIYDLEVPDYAKAPLALGGLVLTSASATVMPTARADETLKALLPGPPVASREFPRNDQVAFYTEAYENQGGASHKVDITAIVIDEDGQTVFRTASELESSDLQGKGANGFTARLPIKDMEPGTYVLRVEAKSRLGKNVSAMRELQFGVVAAQTP